jgi:hypothetical protein
MRRRAADRAEDDGRVDARTKSEWRACVIARSKTRIRLSAARFDVTLRSTAGSPAPPRSEARSVRLGQRLASDVLAAAW